MAGLARALAERAPGRYLEHLQGASTLEGLLQELEALELKEAKPLLLGYSFGAWLAWLFARRFPERFCGVALVGCGPFRAGDVERISQARAKALGEEGFRRYQASLAKLRSPQSEARAQAWESLGALGHASDSVQPGATWVEEMKRDLDLDPSAGEVLMKEAGTLRCEGKLLGEIVPDLPIYVFHGRQDPHPWDAVVEPLRSIGGEPRVVLFEDCGHTPWIEVKAREAFLDAVLCCLGELEGTSA